MCVHDQNICTIYTNFNIILQIPRVNHSISLLTRCQNLKKNRESIDSYVCNSFQLVILLAHTLYILYIITFQFLTYFSSFAIKLPPHSSAGQILIFITISLCAIKKTKTKHWTEYKCNVNNMKQTALLNTRNSAMRNDDYFKQWWLVNNNHYWVIIINFLR